MKAADEYAQIAHYMTRLQEERRLQVQECPVEIEEGPELLALALGRVGFREDL